MYVRKPAVALNGKWAVIISESRSPLSSVIEKMEFDSREEAWKAYRQAMKESMT